ncbi:MAG: hypothetical protein JWO09_1174 [Bacteroidetes bacterium]|nr:hypothetical protein [Bacteroidota bacterium]
MKNSLNVFTAISYCLILVSSTHFAAPMFFMVLLGFGAGNFLLFMQSLLITAFLVYLIAGWRRRVKKRDLYIFPAGGMILLLPIIEQCSWLKKFENMNFFDDRLFAGTTCLFMFFLILTISGIFREYIRERSEAGSRQS